MSATVGIVLRATGGSMFLVSLDKVQEFAGHLFS